MLGIQNNIRNFYLGRIFSIPCITALLRPPVCLSLSLSLSLFMSVCQTDKVTLLSQKEQQFIDVSPNPSQSTLPNTCSGLSDKLICNFISGVPSTPPSHQLLGDMTSAPQSSLCQTTTHPSTSTTISSSSTRPALHQYCHLLLSAARRNN